MVGGPPLLCPIVAVQVCGHMSFSGGQAVMMVPRLGDDVQFENVCEMKALIHLTPSQCHDLISRGSLEHYFEYLYSHHSKSQNPEISFTFAANSHLSSLYDLEANMPTIPSQTILNSHHTR